MRKLFYLNLLLSLFVLGCSAEEELKYSLKVSTSDSSGGIVSPDQGSYVPGTNVSIMATPSEYYSFKEWKGDENGETNPITLVMDSNKSITAIFELKDTDGDGVVDKLDECNDTEAGRAVDEKGCSLVPQIDVNEDIRLNTPGFIDLQIVGGWAYLDAGVSGIIIYHSGINTYKAYERSAPHLKPEPCSQLKILNGIMMECDCDNSQFNILNGLPITDGIDYPVIQYKVQVIGSNSLRITNF